MAAFTIIELNGDHIGSCDPEELGQAIIALCHNLHNEKYILDRCSSGVQYALRAIGCTGNRINPVDLQAGWLDWGRSVPR